MQDAPRCARRRLRPTSTRADAPLIQAQRSVLECRGIHALMWPRNAGSYPGFVYTDPPLSLASGHCVLGQGSGAHAPDEYYTITSTNPAVRVYDGAVMSFVEYLYELAEWAARLYAVPNARRVRASLSRCDAARSELEQCASRSSASLSYWLRRR